MHVRIVYRPTVSDEPIVVYDGGIEVDFAQGNLILRVSNSSTRVYPNVVHAQIS